MVCRSRILLLSQSPGNLLRKLCHDAFRVSRQMLCFVLFLLFIIIISLFVLVLRSWLLLTQRVQKGGFPCGQIEEWKGSEKTMGVVAGFTGSVVLAHLKVLPLWVPVIRLPCN